jgi:hypothetical protein
MVQEKKPIARIECGVVEWWSGGGGVVEWWSGGERLPGHTAYTVYNRRNPNLYD